MQPLDILILISRLLQVALISISGLSFVGFGITGVSLLALSLRQPGASIRMLPQKVRTLYKWSLALFIGGPITALLVRLCEAGLLQLMN